jgi:hypothetical protein
LACRAVLAPSMIERLTDAWAFASRCRTWRAGFRETQSIHVLQSFKGARPNPRSRLSRGDPHRRSRFHPHRRFVRSTLDDGVPGFRPDQRSQHARPLRDVRSDGSLGSVANERIRQTPGQGQPCGSGWAEDGGWGGYGDEPIPGQWQRCTSKSQLPRDSGPIRLAVLRGRGLTLIGGIIFPVTKTAQC